MANIRILAIALASSWLAAVPAQAGGLLGGGAANCLCNVVGGVLGGGAPTAPSPRNPVGSLTGTVSRITGSGMSRQGSITGSVSNSVSGALGVMTARSIDRRNGTVAGNVGLAGTVSSVTNATVGANGLGKSVGLAGSSSTSGSVNKQVGIGLTGVGTNHARSLAGQVAGTANAVVGQSRGIGQGSGASLAGTVNGMADATLAKTHGGGEGGNGSLTATVHSATNGALAITKSHGGVGGSNGGLGLPNGVQIINGVPCGPDGKPLTGAAAAAAMALIGGNGGSTNHGSGGSNSGSSAGGSNGSNSSSGAGNGGSQGSRGASANSNSNERDMADRKDLWWPPSAEQQSRAGRLNDH